MTTLRVYRAGVADPPPTTGGTTLRVYRAAVDGAAAVASKLRVYRAAVSGASATTLTPDRTSYDPGQTVTITADQITAGAEWSATGEFAQPLTINDKVCTFTAPATIDGTKITVKYGAFALLTINVNAAFVLVTRNNVRYPATVWVNS